VRDAFVIDRGFDHDLEDRGGETLQREFGTIA